MSGHPEQSVGNIQIFKYFLQIIFIFLFAVKKIMNNIHILIGSRLGLWILFVFVFIQEKNIRYTPNSPIEEKKKNKERRFFSLNVNLITSMKNFKQKKGFDIVSTIFRLVSSSNLFFDYFLNILIHIHETRCQEWYSYCTFIEYIFCK